MTPLEELQAAHKRLSELRPIANPDKPYRNTWRIVGGRDGYVEIGDHYGDIVSSWGDHSSLPVSEQAGELIVTMHRTIDAQLAILNYAMVHEEARPSLRHEGSVHAGIILARAINGGTE
ncbi:hypothetical protein [Curtobacterium sp. USHLN213]|uniref:hypothetical protein n=1 Tax=Curtobacterium sp. USHLN213 TaxID=3081255 RepID=UPI0030176E21